MPTYRVQSPIKHDGKRFEPGDTVSMDAAAAAPLLGTILEDPAAPAAAPPDAAAGPVSTADGAALQAEVAALRARVAEQGTTIADLTAECDLWKGEANTLLGLRERVLAVSTEANKADLVAAVKAVQEDCR